MVSSVHIDGLKHTHQSSFLTTRPSINMRSNFSFFTIFQSGFQNIPILSLYQHDTHDIAWWKHQDRDHSPLVCWHVQEEGVRISGLSFKRKMMFDDIVPWGNVIRVNVRDCEAMYWFENVKQESSLKGCSFARVWVRFRVF
jgi:hypothetical protein